MQIKLVHIFSAKGRCLPNSLYHKGYFSEYIKLSIAKSTSKASQRMPVRPTGSILNTSEIFAFSNHGLELYGKKASAAVSDPSPPLQAPACHVSEARHLFRHFPSPPYEP